MVYGTYNYRYYSIHGVYKPSNITGGPHIVFSNHQFIVDFPIKNGDCSNNDVIVDFPIKMLDLSIVLYVYQAG